MAVLQSHSNAYTPIPASPSQWKIHWFTPLIMGLTFVLGICTAILHHILYQGREDKNAIYQQWYTRAGTGLAFLTKTLFVACIGISHRQRIWHTLRNKFITIGGIDALFGATVNPLSLFNLDMMLNSKLSATMAVLSWLVPLSAIVTPATLSVAPKEFGPIDLNTTVPYIDLTNWSPWYDDYPNMSRLGVARSNWGSNSSDFWYSGPSGTTMRIAEATFFGGSILPIQSPIKSNYSYTVEFYGPTLSCNNTGNEITKKRKSYGGIYFYIASLEPVDGSTVDGKLGLRNRLQVYTDSHPNGNNNDTGRTIQNILCTPYNASYSVYLNFTLGIPVYTIQNLTLLSPMDESSAGTKESHGYNGSAVSENSANAWPARSVITGIYNTLLGDLFYNNWMETETTVLLTKLFNNPSSPYTFPLMNITFVDNISGTIEEMSHNLTLSLLSIADSQIPTTIQFREFRLVFIYTRWVLVTAYGSAAIAALLCLVTGLVALGANGISSDVTFSRVLVTTRNIDLDDLALGECLGGDPIPEVLRKRKLKFGEIGLIKDVGRKGNNVSHAGFGMGEVASLQKGKKYM